jgi:hypothetical protein
MRPLARAGNTMRWLTILGAMVALQLGTGPALALACSKEDFGKAVDQAGAALRKVNAENTPRLQAKMRQLKEKEGWPDVGFEERGFTILQDERVAQLDAQANDLLSRLDALGSFEPKTDADCAKLEDLTATSLELQATVKAKAAYTLAKLDQMLAGAPSVAGLQSEQPPPRATAEPKAKPAERKAQAPPPAPAAAPASPPAVKPPAKVAEKGSERVPEKAPETSAWSTRTIGEPQREIAMAQPGTPLPPGPPLGQEDEGYTIDEIKAASEGFFGKVSSGLASVIEHVFSSSGRPKGYILGQEGGGAFLAGVRYGNGTLYMRSGGTQKIFWHGPSIGTDVGADGSKTLFLIYRLKSPEQLYANFTGIDGSAYLVGGVGATLTTNGDVIMAPIRSGVGLRLGANIGYIRFTPRQTWNPF